MSVPLFPLSLPKYPMESGYHETYPSNLIRSETDTGPAKVRRRGNAKPVTVTAHYMMTTAQCEILESFVNDMLGGGAICFDWYRPLYEGGKYTRARLKAAQDGIYTKSFIAGSIDRWDVELQLEIFPDVPVTR